MPLIQGIDGQIFAKKLDMKMFAFDTVSVMF